MALLFTIEASQSNGAAWRWGFSRLRGSAHWHGCSNKRGVRQRAPLLVAPLTRTFLVQNTGTEERVVRHKIRVFSKHPRFLGLVRPQAPLPGSGLLALERRARGPIKLRGLTQMHHSSCKIPGSFFNLHKVKALSARVECLRTFSNCS